MRTAFAAAAVLLAAALAGCYAPSPRSGSYLCADDGSCPSGLRCSPCAKVCVQSDSDDVCALRLSLDAPPACSPALADACVREGGDLSITVTALARDGAPSTYSGAGTLSSTWGHARPQPRRDEDPFSFRFQSGSARLTVRLDRATPNNATAQLRARVGAVEGVSLQTVIIDPRPFQSPASILTPGTIKWAEGFIGFPAVDRTPTGEYRMYVSGLPNLLSQAPRARIGVASSPTGAPGSWSLSASALFESESAHYFAPSVLRLADGSVRLFTSVIPSDSKGETMGAPSLQMARAGDGTTFGALAPVLPLASCPFCTANGGLAYPWALRAPGDAGEWLLFFSTIPKDATSTAVGVARTIDGGTTWHVSPVPSPSSGQAVPGFQVALAPRVLYDERDGIYRMWYAENANPGAAIFDPCKSNIGYATSEDGLFFSGSRRVSLSFADVKWAPPGAEGVYPGAVLPRADGGWEIYFSPVINLLNVCLPVGVGRALDEG